MARASKTNAVALTFGDALDIGRIEALREQLMQALQSGADAIALETQHVGRVDAAAVQVLAAFVRDARAAGIAVQWKEPSAALLRALRLAGLGEWFGLQKQVAQATGE